MLTPMRVSAIVVAGPPAGNEAPGSCGVADCAGCPAAVGDGVDRPGVWAGVAVAAGEWVTIVGIDVLGDGVMFGVDEGCGEDMGDGLRLADATGVAVGGVPSTVKSVSPTLWAVFAA